jgi:hypothetical protein
MNMQNQLAAWLAMYDREGMGSANQYSPAIPGGVGQLGAVRVQGNPSGERMQWAQGMLGRDMESGPSEAEAPLRPRVMNYLHQFLGAR